MSLWRIRSNDGHFLFITSERTGNNDPSLSDPCHCEGVGQIMANLSFIGDLTKDQVKEDKSNDDQLIVDSWHQTGPDQGGLVCIWSVSLWGSRSNTGQSVSQYMVWCWKRQPLHPVCMSSAHVSTCCLQLVAVSGWLHCGEGWLVGHLHSLLLCRRPTN